MRDLHLKTMREYECNNIKVCIKCAWAYLCTHTQHAELCLCLINDNTVLIEMMITE